jgi:hypothetical protein
MSRHTEQAVEWVAAKATACHKWRCIHFVHLGGLSSLEPDAAGANSLSLRLALLEDEVLLRDSGGVIDAGQQDRLTGRDDPVWADANQCIRADIGDRYAVPKIVGGDPEG